jgi:D-alanine-D-alanine ligase
MALDVYNVLDCAGFARVDFLLEKHTQQLYVNEINTIPGFTAISMYPKLMEAVGITYQSLISNLIDLAFEEKL